MAIITSTLERIKADPVDCLGGRERVNAVFSKAGHVWRECFWDPAATLGAFIVQVLHGNASMAQLRHLTHLGLKESTYCDARLRLPAAGVASVVETICGDCRRNNDEPRTWLGHRVFVADATSATAPDEAALQDLWPQPSAQKSGCGFAAIKLLGTLDLVTGMIVRLSLMCMNVHEMSQLPALHAMLRAGDVLLADRGFCSFWHLAMLAKSSLFAVFRMHQRQIVDFTPDRPHRAKRGKRARRGVPTSRYVRRLGHEDHLVEWARPADRPQWMSEQEYAQIPRTVRVRELRYPIAIRGRRTRVVTIATTLTDAMRYSKRRIAALYGLRWEIETNFRHLKTTMKMDQLKCQTVEGVVKELMVFVLVYNLIRAAMTLAADRQGVDPNRISFIDAQRRLCSLLCQPATQLPIDLIVNRIREGRWQPRVIKRRIKPYDLMNRPRKEYAQPSPTEGVTA
jgi:Transposase DDE domain